MPQSPIPSSANVRTSSPATCPLKGSLNMLGKKCIRSRRCLAISSEVDPAPAMVADATLASLPLHDHKCKDRL